MRDQQGGHLRLVHPQADPVAGDPRLAHLEQRGADAVAVADPDLVIGESFDGEVLAELPVAEIVAVQERLPVAIGLQLVEEDRTVHAAMPGQVALSVAVDVEATDHPPFRDGVLPDPGADRPSLPLHVSWHTDIDRHEPAGRRSGSHGVTASLSLRGEHIADLAYHHGRVPGGRSRP